MAPDKKYMIVKINRMKDKRQILHKDLTGAKAAILINQYRKTPYHTFAIVEQLFTTKSDG